jgi:two-component system chemotaxis sensor kinase CheA
LKDIRQRLLATFQVEHRDHVEQIRALLAAVDTPAGLPPGPQLDEAFRRAHSLKGAARAVDLRPIEGLAHRLETLFSRVRQGSMALNKEAAAVVFQVLDASEDCLAGMSENRPRPGLTPALQAIERLLGMEPEPESAPVVQAVPAFQPIETVRVTAQNFDGLLRSAGGLLAESDRQNQVASLLSAISRQMAGLQKEAAQMRRAAAALAQAPGSRHDWRRVTAFFDNVERQTRLLTRQTAGARRLQQRSAWSTSQLSKQLQRDVWQARMVPAEGLLEGYRQMVRELARDSSKEIDFRATSTRVHADRGVLESLKDPIMHLLRNAVSHGIELPRERLEKGKPPAGMVTLRIDTEGQHLTATVEDDGRGVDLVKVAELAVQQGILSPSETGHYNTDDLTRILFRPGFSTLRAVTDLAGRGMGLSVVHGAVRRLQGDLEVRPREGGGTLIRLSVPLSIATHRFLLVNCGNQLFAIPIHGIERLLRIGFQNVQTMEGKPVVAINGQPVPLFSMRRLLNLERGPEADPLRVMLVRGKGRRAAVAVDEFLSESEAVIHDLGPAAAPDGKISGAVLLDDGAVAFVVNPSELIEAPPSEPFTLEKAAPPVPKFIAPSILVVDDSITTRTLEQSILEANGYDVRVAVDGIDALAALHAQKADLVIADVQMPRLDGFGLLEAMKADAALGRIPVIVVTSLERREDQERGLRLGADAYIVKRKFDQGELLAAIRQILGAPGSANA